MGASTPITILAIETSCDETSAAVVRYRRGSFEVLSSVVSSQIAIHKKYGGVVPEVAARKQVELIIPVIEQALILAQQNEAGSWKLEAGKSINKIFQIPNSKFQIPPHIDALAVTAGPGLMIALSVGVETVRTLAAVWKKPVVAVNHLEGHLYSALVSTPEAQGLKLKAKGLDFPAIALIVSGGHTELVLVKDYLKHELLGRTRDDAAGEAYDKVAKLLGLSYPGGPIIDKLAREGNPQAFDFPRGMIKSGDYDFSFAGLKTAVLYTLQKISPLHRHPERSEGSSERKRAFGASLDSSLPLRMTYKNLLSDLCASFQAAVVDVLVDKTIRAARQYQAKTILLGGGVAANSQLRAQLAQTTDKLENCRLLIPALAYTTDNAAMIAAAAALHAARKQFTPWQKLKADPGISL